tara:strand:- start:3001 stop:3189 length:189 start_codon:yes stop_codon:yes gene_type:complete
MQTIMLHRVKKIELTEPNALTSANGIFWRRKLSITDEKGNTTEINLFADTEEPLDIKETFYG